MRGSTISCVLATALTACAVDETPGDAVVESELSVPDGIWVPNAFGASATVSSQELRSTTDPGRALVTGLWADMDRFKVPGLRALAARPPYFHDGSAATLDAVVRHYEANLGFVITDAQRADLVAFLAAL